MNETQVSLTQLKTRLCNVGETWKLASWVAATLISCFPSGPPLRSSFCLWVKSNDSCRLLLPRSAEWAEILWKEYWGWSGAVRSPFLFFHLSVLRPVSYDWRHVPTTKSQQVSDTTDWRQEHRWYSFPYVVCANLGRMSAERAVLYWHLQVILGKAQLGEMKNAYCFHQFSLPFFFLPC